MPERCPNELETRPYRDDFGSKSSIFIDFYRFSRPDRSSDLFEDVATIFNAFSSVDEEHSELFRALLLSLAQEGQMP